MDNITTLVIIVYTCMCMHIINRLLFSPLLLYRLKLLHHGTTTAMMPIISTSNNRSPPTAATTVTGRYTLLEVRGVIVDSAVEVVV